MDRLDEGRALALAAALLVERQDSAAGSAVDAGHGAYAPEEVWARKAVTLLLARSLRMAIGEMALLVAALERRAG